MEFFLDHLVAFTSAGIQSWSVNDPDVTTAVTDQTRALQISGGFCDAFAADAEDAGNHFLCHSQLTRGQSIKGQQQPATQLLFDGMMAVAGRSLGYLCN